MIKQIYDSTGAMLLDQIDTQPICGKDFCNTCGDCLACYADDPCADGHSAHRWIEYRDPIKTKAPTT